VQALFVTIPGENQAAAAVVAPAVARRLHVPVQPIGLLLTGAGVDDRTEQTLREATSAVAPTANVYVERGYQDDTTTVALLILGGVGALLMLTATFLALSEARPDLATLAAVGAAPRVRRRVAAGYAGVIGLVGALLGAAVGFVPGLAVTYPLTSRSWQPAGTLDASGVPLPGHFVDVPWLLVAGVVVLLPLLTAAVVGVAARSRLPMVARLG
jgi:putative ABC transport system permease protein